MATVRGATSSKLCFERDTRGILQHWEIDIAGLFPEGLGKVKFLIVAIDYFTKWIEAKPVATIIGNQIKKFVWDYIVCRFGLPGEIISDVDSDSRERLSQLIENSSRITHSKIGVRNYVSANTLLLLNICKPMAW
ncbi:reverse transcriptase domain-containing protein [Tanacetum coccineum]